MSIDTRLVGKALLVSVLLAFLVSGTSDPASAQDPLSLEAVQQAWKMREKSVRTLILSWEGECDRLRTHAMRISGRLPTQVPNPQDKARVAFKATMRLVYDDRGRQRVENTGRVFAADRDELVPYEATDIRDGTQAKTFFAKGPLGYPSLHISRPKNEGRDAKLLPIALVFRPFGDNGARFESAALSLVSSARNREGRQELVVRHNEETVVVDADRGYVPTHYTSRRDGKVNREIIIEYRRVADQWVPSAWNNVYVAQNGTVLESFAGKISECTINGEVQNELFDVVGPPGTMVNNTVTGEFYIIRDGERKRPIMPGEFDVKTYEELLSSEPPVAPSGGLGRLTIALCILLGVAAIALVFVLRAQRRARRIA